MQLLIISFSPASCYFHLRPRSHWDRLSTLLNLNIPLSTLFSNTSSLQSFPSMRQDLHPHKTTGKHTHFYILMCMFSDGRQQVKDYECSCSKHYTKLMSSHFLDDVTCISLHCYQSFNLAPDNPSLIVQHLRKAVPRISNVCNFRCTYRFRDLSWNIRLY
jgi:hypothetical protein